MTKQRRHIRRSKRGKRFIAGRRLKKQLQIYLKPSQKDINISYGRNIPLKMHERHLSEGEVGPYTMLDIPKKTFIGYGLKNINFNNPENIDILSNILEHEELHKVLEKEIGEEATRSLDNINVPLVTDSGKIINPKTASTISLIKTQKAREIKQQNIPFEKKWKKFDEEA